MTINTELQEKIAQECRKWYDRGIAEFYQEEEPLEILFTLSGEAAGNAMAVFATITSYGKNVVNFNMILAEENEEEFLSQTVPHEIAHIIADKFYNKRCVHNHLWQSVMIKWGKDPERCHHFSTENSSRSRRNYSWKCVKCQKVFLVGKNLNGKIKNNSARYACSNCHQKNTLVNATVEISFDF